MREPSSLKVTIRGGLGAYSASIPHLCLIESGDDIVEICERIIARAHAMVAARDAGWLYIPPPAV